MENLASDSLSNDHPAGETSVSPDPANLSEHASPKEASFDKKLPGLPGQLYQEHGHLNPTNTKASNLLSTASAPKTPPKDTLSQEPVNVQKLTNTESGERASEDVANAQIRNSSSKNNDVEEEELETVNGDNSARRENKAGDRFQEHISTMEERLSVLEKARERRRWHSRDRSNSEESSLPSIPKLHRVKWTEFKTKSVGEKQTYAIEVLEGPAKYWYQFREQAHPTTGALAEDDGDQSLSSVGDAGIRTRTPDRIRINSNPLRLILAHLSDSPFTPGSEVMLRPFKLLVYYEKSIRETLVKLEHKWGDIDRNKSSEQPLQNDDSNEDGRLDKSDPNPTTAEIMDSVEALRDLRCLIEFIDHDLRPTMDILKDDSCQKVRFEDLWHIFQPGVEVYSPPDGRRESEPMHAKMYQELGRVLNTSDGRPKLTHHPKDLPSTVPLWKIGHFYIHCYYLDFNGSIFGPVSYMPSIVPFEGERDIRSLKVYPLRFAADASGIRDRLRRRGEKFLELINSQPRYCRGKTLTCQPDGSPLRRESVEQPEFREPTNPPQLVDSEVIVDFKDAVQRIPGYSPRFTWKFLPRIDLTLLDDRCPVEYWHDQERSNTITLSFDEIYYDPLIDVLLTEDYRETDSILKNHWRFEPIQSADLQDKDLILLPERVLGFVLRDNRYAPLSINDLHPIKPCELRNLKLPHGHKKIVQALVQGHFDQGSSNWSADGGDNEPDFIRGKGKSLVILLHGVSGVGKTATAECVAQANGKPLFPLNFGTLGLVPDDVELELRERFRLAQLWGCILLLDEADVFLAQRSTSDLERNSLVAVFLRVLEYFSGIIFLTTNRVKELDYALKSRIDIKLYYPPLTEKQARSIWKMHLHPLLAPPTTTTPRMFCDEQGILEFAASRYNAVSKKASWDARQIRNAFKTATLLAQSEARLKSNATRPHSHSQSHHTHAHHHLTPRLEKKHFEMVAGDFYTHVDPLPPVRRRVESDDDELAPWPRHVEDAAGKGQGNEEREVPANWIDPMEDDGDSD